LTRNVAISNGSECGNIQDFNPGDNLMSIDTSHGLSYLQNLAVPLVSFLGFVNLNPVDFILGTALNLLSSGGRFNFNFNADALNYNSTQIYSGNITYTRLLFGFIPLTSNFTNVQKNQPSSLLPFDTYGGGFYDTSSLADNINLSGVSVRDKFGFIPTASALDIGSNNLMLTDVDYKKAYVGANPPSGSKSSPFVNFTSDWDTNPNSRNKAHISFSIRNGEWLANELGGVPITTDCSFVCDTNQPLGFMGDNQICNNSTSNYSINNIATEANINWSISPAGGFTLTVNSNNNISITPNGNFGGIATLSAQITTDCANTFTVSKEIQAGAERPIKYDRNGDQIGTLNFCALTWGSISFNIPGTLEWDWQIGFGNYNLQAGSTNYAQVFSSQPTSGMLRVRRRDACGWSPYTFFVINFSNCSGGGFRYSTFPNPTTDFINIIENETNAFSEKSIINKSSTKSNSKNNVSAKLYDLKGNIVKEIPSIAGALDVSGLKTGQYVLIITFEGKQESHHIMIE